MGIFKERGVVYYVVLCSGEHISINTMELTDERLKSSQYLKRKGGRQAYVDYHAKDHVEPITDSDFDISLSDLEQLKLQEVLRGAKDVKMHGWFDVQSTSCTYDM